MVYENGISLAQATACELLLFAGVGLIIFGLDEMMTDLIWLVRGISRRLTVYRRNRRATVATLTSDRLSGQIAIFIPAWDEATVIAAMLRNALAVIDDQDYRVYVGTYPNDPSTADAVRSINDPRVTVVTNQRPGPTTKADCLNALWAALEQNGRQNTIAVVLHDAEDVIHRHELTIFRALLGRFDFIQLPVMPLINPTSLWIEGHYADEFAESHGKTVVVREAIGASIPAAGVGCAFRIDALARLAADRNRLPFDSRSLTEDYELGLRLGEYGFRGAFVRLPEASGKLPVAVHAHFPDQLEAAVRQKARWIVGIALAGWDRLGWRGGIAERWMRLHDRRAIISALLLLAAYFGLFIQSTAMIAGWFVPAPPVQLSSTMKAILLACSALLIWRLAMRAMFTARAYGWRQGLLAIPRAVVANAITIMAARRAFGLYWQARRDGLVRWDKTAHRFPQTP